MALEIEKLCPTCGSKLDAHRRAEMARCTECRRLNPTGFLYCGYCATPMESADVRGKVTAAAAPDGGWPNLSGELIQVKFYLQQGRLDEAYDALSILQRRYPGHPELADFNRGAAMQADADVACVVDEVLANSAKLTDKIERRQAPTWKAPKAPGISQHTAAHEAVRSNGIDAEGRPVPEAEPLTDVDGEEITIPLEAAAKRALAAVEAEYKAKAKAKAKTEMFSPIDPRIQTGHTVAVPTLQPATPFRSDDRPDDVSGEISASQPTRKLAAPKTSHPKGKRAAGKPSRKRPLKRAPKTSRKMKVVTGQQPVRKPFGESFGAGVLSRFGR
jgi:hypothetical protein